MARNSEALRITLTISPDDKELFEQVSQTAPYRRGRYLLRLAARGLLLEGSQLRGVIEHVTPQSFQTAASTVPAEVIQVGESTEQATPQQKAVPNALEMDLSDLWSSNMLKM